MHLYFHVLIIPCADTFVFVFSIQVGFFCDTSRLLLVLWHIFFLPLHWEGRPFLFQLERKTLQTWDVLVFFFFLYLALTGKWNWCSIFFWTNIQMRSSLSDGIALSSTFLWQSVSLNTASLQISHLEMKKKRKMLFVIRVKYFLCS